MPLTGTPYYATSNDLTDFWGNDIIVQWSDLDGTGSINTTRVNNALLIADAKINAVFASYGTFLATNTDYVTASPEGMNLLNQWSCVIAGVYLYEVRSGRDEKYLNNLEPRLKQVMEDIRLTAASAKMGMNIGAQPRWPVTNAAVRYRPNELGPWRQ